MNIITWIATALQIQGNLADPFQLALLCSELLIMMVLVGFILKQLSSIQKEAVEKKALEKREELPLTALEDDKLLGRHRVRLNIFWEKEIKNRDKLNFFKGFPATLFITESRLIITSEFYSHDKASRFVGQIPVGWMRYNTVYVELAINKIKKYSFGIFGSYIQFEPHGKVGETKIIFYKLSRNERQLIKEDLETARIFKKPAPGAGIVILDRPIGGVVTQRFAMLRHEAVISKYFKKPELKKVPIERVIVKETANISATNEGNVQTQNDIEEFKENAAKLNQQLENIIGATPQERVWLTLQAQVTKCRFCGQEILKSSKKCSRCGAVNF
ncbi:MAG: hypothetical protein ACUVXA_03130 [Candidatus Jordarchaeum sp.]|uniref:hypothetical protein n=1 Tax=Candidatus Jordarchaeum sp. TaxID=2823881 RepID=UPI00404AE363